MIRRLALCLTVMVALTSLSGCYGRFALTKKVYQLNGEVQDRYVRSAVTWAFIIVPVYGLAALLDFVFFNTVEFWGGKALVSETAKEFFYADGNELYRVHATRSGDAVQYNITHYQGSEQLDALVINWDLKSGNSLGVFQKDGEITGFQAVKEVDGVKVVKEARQHDSAGGVVAFYK